VELSCPALGVSTERVERHVFAPAAPRQSGSGASEHYVAEREFLRAAAQLHAWLVPGTADQRVLDYGRADLVDTGRDRYLDVARQVLALAERVAGDEGAERIDAANHIERRVIGDGGYRERVGD